MHQRLSLTRVAITFAAAQVLIACAKPAPSTPAPTSEHKKIATRSGLPFTLKTHGLSGMLPPRWKLTESTDGYRASCTQLSKDSDCVILIQTQPVNSDGRAISSVLQLKNQLLDELKRVDSSGKLLRTAVYDKDGVSGLRMETRFRHDGHTWRKDMLLVQRPAAVLMLSLAASDEAFSQALPAWKRLIESLRFTPLRED